MSTKQALCVDGRVDVYDFVFFLISEGGVESGGRRQRSPGHARLCPSDRRGPSASAVGTLRVGAEKNDRSRGDAITIYAITTHATTTYAITI